MSELHVDILDEFEKQRRKDVVDKLLMEFENDPLFKLLKENNKEKDAIEKAVSWIYLDKFLGSPDVAKYLQPLFAHIKNDHYIRNVIRILKPYIDPDESAKVYRFDYKSCFRFILIAMLQEDNMKLPMIAKTVGVTGQEKDDPDDRLDEIEKNQEAMAKALQTMFSFSGDRVDFNPEFVKKLQNLVIPQEQPLLPPSDMRSMIQEEISQQIIESMKQVSVTAPSEDPVIKELIEKSKSLEAKLEENKITNDDPIILALVEKNKVLEDKLTEEKVANKDREFVATNLRRRIESELRKEAMRLWEQQPESYRYTRSLFGMIKQEKITERDRFILDYIDQNYEERYKKAMTDN